jgi:hypothetical protein
MLFVGSAAVTAAAILNAATRYRVNVVKRARPGDAIKETHSSSLGSAHDLDGNIQLAAPDNLEDSGTKRNNASEPSWLKTLGVVTPALAIAGVVIYGILSLGYDRFYAGLAVDPADVGISYTSTLANSPGFVAAAGIVIIALYFTVYRRLRRYGRRPRGDHSSELNVSRDGKSASSGPSRIAGWILVLLLLFALIGIAAIPIGANYAARAVRNGRPVTTPYFLTLFPTLEIHARPVTVQSASKDPSAIDQLPSDHNLFYLGQANGKIVIYDSTAHQAVYVPDSLVILRVTNCAGRRPPSPICKQRYRYNIPWSLDQL